MAPPGLGPQPFLYDLGAAAGPAAPAGGGAYWMGLVALAIGLAATVGALATHLTSIVQTVLVAAPLLLTGLGLERVGRGVRRGSLRAVGGALALLAIAGPILLATLSPGTGGAFATAAAPVPAGATQGLLRATLGGGQFRIQAGASGLFQAELRSQGQPSVQVSTSGKTAVADLRGAPQRGLLARNRGSDWTAKLTTGLPWSVDVEGGALTLDVDLRQLDTRNVQIGTGITRLALRLGAPAATVPVNIQVTTGFVDVYVPRSAALTIRVAGLSLLGNFQQQGLAKQGGAWRTSDASSATRFDIVIHATVARVRLHRQ